MNTPERNEPCYAEATAANASLVTGQVVTLHKDVSETDRYGRLLRYVYVGNQFVNAELVMRGYAEAVEYPPDTAQAGYLESLEAGARAANLNCYATGVFGGGGLRDTPTPTQPTPPTPPCDPAYPDVCIPPPPLDLGNLGNAYAALGEPRRAIEFYEQHLKVAREIGDRHGEGAALGNLGNVYAALSEPRRAIELYEQVLVIDREIGDRRGESSTLVNTGNAYYSLGEPRRAIEYHEQALPIFREIGNRRGEGNALWNMSFVLDKLGERSQAIAYAEAALKIYEQIESPSTEKVRKQLEGWKGSSGVNG